MGTDDSRQPIVDGIREELSRKSRRRWSSRPLPLYCLTACIFVFAGAKLFAAETYDLRASLKPGAVQQVQAAIEVRGDLLLEAGDGQRQRLPMVVTGKVAYDERLLAIDDAKGSRRSVRWYRDAGAEVKVGQGLANPQLNSERRMLVAQIDDSGSTLFSPLGPLSRDDLELLDVQGNSLAVSAVLPNQSVRIGDHWEPNRELLAVLLGLDVITRSDVQGTLEKLDGRTAILTIQGSIDGAAEGVASKIELKAKANCDLDRRAVTWLAANFRERRDVGHAEPGFDVTARPRLAISPQDESASLSDQALSGLPLTAAAGSTLLELRPQRTNFRLIHDRRWHVLLDRHDLCVLRCVDRGDLLAQCNISELTDAELGKRLALERFQAEVLESLSSSAGQIVEASQNVTDEGRRILRVQATGVASEIPIAWVFYHISNDQGRQAALSFTLEAKVAERFGAGDRSLVESFEFTPRPPPQEAKRTPPASPGTQ